MSIQIEYHDPRTLVPDDSNPNRMSSERYEALKRAIAHPKIGFLQPVLVREEYPAPLEGADGLREHPNKVLRIWDGHHRVRAAIEVGLTGVPCVVVPEGTDPDVIAAVVLGMNRLHGELDLTAVSEIMKQLANDEDWTLDEMLVTGFNESEIADLLALGTDNTDNDVMKDAAGLPDDEPPVDKPFLLEITFSNRDEYVEARKALKRAAGKNGELSDGLMRVLGLREV